MANRNFTIGFVHEAIKKELVKTGQLPHQDTTSLYFFCQKKLLKSSDGTHAGYLVLSDLAQFKDPEDNFLYLMIAEAETF